MFGHFIFVIKGNEQKLSCNFRIKKFVGGLKSCYSDLKAASNDLEAEDVFYYLGLCKYRKIVINYFLDTDFAPSLNKLNVTLLFYDVRKRTCRGSWWSVYVRFRIKTALHQKWDALLFAMKNKNI